MGELYGYIDWDMGEAAKAAYSTEDVQRLVNVARDCIIPVALSRPGDDDAIAIAKELKAALAPFTETPWQ